MSAEEVVTTDAAPEEKTADNPEEKTADDPTFVMDCDPSGWTISDQMAYREKAGVNAHFAMVKIGQAFESGGAAAESVPDAVYDIPPQWLLALAWITARRKDKSLTFEKMADDPQYVFSALVNALLIWGNERAESNPSPAPRRTARKK